MLILSFPGASTSVSFIQLMMRWYTSTMQQVCQVVRFGIIEYQKAWEMQARLSKEIASGKRPATLLLLQHPHIYTLGRNGKIENLLWDETELAHKGISVQWVDRGGDITYHGPGQLVGYPLLPLGPVSISDRGEGSSARLPRADYIGYIRKLEQVLILSLQQFGVQAKLKPGMTGVWVSREKSSAHDDGKPSDEKVAAIGVKVDVHGISRHGFALNVNPDMRFWQGIIGCGLEGYRSTSLEELLSIAPEMETVEQAVVTAFGNVFGYRMEQADHHWHPASQEKEKSGQKTFRRFDAVRKNL